MVSKHRFFFVSPNLNEWRPIFNSFIIYLDFPLDIN
jgi:hypothetical protein